MKPLGAADWLSLAATPTFAVMALVTSAGGADGFCSALLRGWPLHGMTAMYGLMAVFHAAPWLRLIASRRSSVSPTQLAPASRHAEWGSSG